MNQDPKAPVIYGETIEAGNKPVSHRWRAKVAAVCNALTHFKMIFMVDFGDGIAVPIAGDVKLGKEGLIVTSPALTAGAGIYPGGGGATKQMKIVSDGGDYLLCKTWDGTNLGSTSVKVAKPYKNRTSLASEVIGGVTYNYTYAAIVVSTVTIGWTRTNSWTISAVNYTETEEITPPTLPNDIIYAVAFKSATPSSLVDATLLDLNADARAWATTS